MIIYIIRGLPGSGKSTFAKSLGCLHVEADMVHISGGEYRFSKDKAKIAHLWCQGVVSEAMESKIDVAVSNTFTQAWEIKPYLDMAKLNGYEAKVIRMTGNFGSIHSVPADVMRRMQERFDDISGEEMR